MTDRELIEFAAKAAGIVGSWERDYAYIQERDYFNVPYDNHNMLTGIEWSPLTDDSDAFRLSVMLLLTVEHDFDRIDVYKYRDLLSVEHIYVAQKLTERSVATRRAIVRAAAEIGKNL